MTYNVIDARTISLVPGDDFISTTQIIVGEAQLEWVADNLSNYTVIMHMPALTGKSVITINNDDDRVLFRLRWS